MSSWLVCLISGLNDQCFVCLLTHWSLQRYYNGDPTDNETSGR